jgi:glutaredoxin
MKKIGLILFLFLIFTPIISWAQTNNLEVYLFYDPECPVCFAAQKFLGQLKAEFPQLEIKSFQPFRNSSSQQLYFSLRKAYQLNADISVPVIFIENQAFTNFNNTTKTHIRQTVIRCASQKCISPLEKISLSEPTPLKKTISPYFFILPAFIILLLGFKFFKKPSN